jgi:hypothetical protein
VHGVIRDYIRSLLIAEQEAGRVGLGVQVDQASDYVTRMTLSVLSSPAGVDLADEAATRALVRSQFLGGIVRAEV